MSTLATSDATVGGERKKPDPVALVSITIAVLSAVCSVGVFVYNTGRNVESVRLSQEAMLRRVQTLEEQQKVTSAMLATIDKSLTKIATDVDWMRSHLDRRK